MNSRRCVICDRSRPCDCHYLLGSAEYRRQYYRATKGKPDGWERKTADPEYFRKYYRQKREAKGGRTREQWLDELRIRREKKPPKRTWEEYSAQRKQEAFERRIAQCVKAETAEEERRLGRLAKEIRSESWTAGQRAFFEAWREWKRQNYDRLVKQQDDVREQETGGFWEGERRGTKYIRRIAPNDSPEEKLRKRREYKRIHGKIWRQQHPEYGHARDVRRRLLEKGIDPEASSASREARRQIREAEKLRCYWCRRWTKRGDRHVDHIIPLAALGALAENPFNLCCSCPECNSKKSDRDPMDFAGQGELTLCS